MWKEGASMRDIEQKINEVNATMAIEGMPLTEDDKTRLRDVFLGKTNAQDVIKQLIEKHAIVGAAQL